jgi:hypothetical protein
MSVKEKAKHIAVELRGHVPFTAFGAALGILFMLLFRHAGESGGLKLFKIFHPGHVLLSAMVTASMFKLHAPTKRFLVVLIVGYFGSVGVATLSDIIIPHLGLDLLGLNVPTHAEAYPHDEGAENGKDAAPAATGFGEADGGEHEAHKIHFGFIDEWYLVNPAALLGILIAFFLPHTKFPHAAHILVSTWASSAYVLMDLQSRVTIGAMFGIFATLFIAVLVPCWISDIVFPLLFVKSDVELAAACPHHGLHSHPHLQVESEG